MCALSYLTRCPESPGALLGPLSTLSPGAWGAKGGGGGPRTPRGRHAVTQPEGTPWLPTYRSDHPSKRALQGSGGDTRGPSPHVCGGSLATLITATPLSGDGEGGMSHRLGALFISRTQSSAGIQSTSGKMPFLFIPDFSSQRLPDKYGLEEGGR